MGTGFRATFVISWSQTEVDGFRGAAPDQIVVGASWRWTGKAVRIDAPGDVLLLEGAEGQAEIRRHAARMVQRLVGVALGDMRQRDGRPPAAISRQRGEGEDAAGDQSFVVTDGLRSHVVTVLPVPDSGARLLMFLGEPPPEGRDLWIVRASVSCAAVALPGEAAASPGAGAGVICFAPGTLLRTPAGAAPIESLRPGDLIQTKDNGAQEVLWTGSRRMSGARLYAMPHLRPVRLRSGALGSGRPEGDLLVSPGHRMLVRGAPARALFNCEEVLVAAGDLVNGGSIAVDAGLREVSYRHLLLERHEIVFANGLETESFHPGATALDVLDPGDRDRLLALMPDLARDPMLYGAFARRNLSATEAAILSHDLAA
ncbi:Hint domain-containing protein [Pseudogemmobacter sonorensis]|uniref:Hint domain-containing protein n=1 Tax=Pseudogemmobacter sonorensis TaxID=2989681 RepID=UPI0036A4A232